MRASPLLALSAFLCLPGSARPLSLPVSRGDFIGGAVALGGSASLPVRAAASSSAPRASASASGSAPERYDDPASVEREGGTVRFRGPVGDGSCASLAAALRDAAEACLAVAREYDLASPPPVRLWMQSEGGALMPAFAIVDRSSPVPVHSVVESYAASAASMIAVACARRFVTPNSLVLIHQLSAGARGRMADVEVEVDNMRLMSGMLRRVYLERTRFSPDRLDALMAEDRWLDAETCLREGVADALL